jgi:hypothetical protein
MAELNIHEDAEITAWRNGPMAKIDWLKVHEDAQALAAMLAPSAAEMKAWEDEIEALTRQLDQTPWSPSTHEERRPFRDRRDILINRYFVEVDRQHWARMTAVNFGPILPPRKVHALMKHYFKKKRLWQEAFIDHLPDDGKSFRQECIETDRQNAHDLYFAALDRWGVENFIGLERKAKAIIKAKPKRRINKNRHNSRKRAAMLATPFERS